MTVGYDLHTHSVHSDGTTTPAEIAKEAVNLGLSGFALTDHDTTDGWSEARVAAVEYGIDFMPGIEITTKHQGASMHLLAYGVDMSRGALSAQIQLVKDSRHTRAAAMVDLLAADFDIDWATVTAAGAERTLGRPHIADALVAAGYYVDRGEAFATVLHPGSKYYIGTHAIDTVAAVDMVCAAGGVAVLAHPAATRQLNPVSAAALHQFTEAGLWGIELDHPENRTEWLPPLAEAAQRLGLRITGASDYHGTGKVNQLGERTSGSDIWQEIRALAAVPA